MKQKKYEKPSLEVVKVQTSVAMLEASNNVQLRNYNNHVYSEE